MPDEPVTLEATIVLWQERYADLVRHLTDLDQRAYPDGPQVIIDGDDWRGQLVVKVADVTRLIQEVEIQHVES